MPHDRLIGILRATGVKSAGWPQQRRQGVLVNPDQRGEKDPENSIDDRHISISAQIYSAVIDKPFLNECLHFAFWQ